MKFDKSIFKNHYGKPYINRIRYTIIADVVSAIIIVLLLALQIQIPVVLALLLCGIIVLSIFPFLPLFLSYYVKALKASQRQKQWFEESTLHVLLVPEDGFTWGAIVTHTKEYIVHNIDDISINNEYIFISGSITLVDKYNDNIEHKEISNFKIPRNFTNEDKILNLGGAV